MKITKLGGTIAGLALVAGVIALPISAASATECIPQAAQPAQGEPIIPNPDYVPAVEEVTETVHHEAEIIEHPAVTETQWKYVRHGGPGEIWLNNNEYQYVDVHGNRADFWDWLLHPVYQRTGHTQEIILDEAWTEVVTEAWDEVVVVTPAQPAIGEPTIPNPDYVPAVEERVCMTPLTPAIPIVNDDDEGDDEDTSSTPDDEEAEEETSDEDSSTVIPKQPEIVVPTQIEKVTTQPVAPQHVDTAVSGDELAVTGAAQTVWSYIIGSLAVGAVILGSLLLIGTRKARR